MAVEGQCAAQNLRLNGQLTGDSNEFSTPPPELSPTAARYRSGRPHESDAASGSIADQEENDHAPH